MGYHGEGTRAYREINFDHILRIVRTKKVETSQRLIHMKLRITDELTFLTHNVLDLDHVAHNCPTLNELK
jgi:hypothetical protein